MTLAPLVGAAVGRPTISFELYPARSPQGRDALWRTVSELAAAAPDFFSVTYGAAGRTRGPSRELLAHVLRETPVAAMAHLTCVGSSRREVVDLACEFLEAGVRNVLALRGDPPADDPHWRPHADGVRHASDLVELLQVADRRRLALRGGARPLDEGPLSLAVAAFPASRHAGDLRGAEGQAGRRRAVRHLPGLLLRGAVRGVPRAGPRGRGDDPRPAGHRPGHLGGAPAAVAGAHRRPRPLGLLARLEAAATHGEAVVRRAGTAFATDLARGLLDAGAPGLHLYTFNSAPAALDLLEGVHLDTGTRSVPHVAAAPQAPADNPTPSISDTAGTPAGGPR